MSWLSTSQMKQLWPIGRRRVCLGQKYALRFGNPLGRLSLGLPLATSRDRLDVLLAHVHRPLFASCPVVSLIHDLSFARLPRSYLSWPERVLMKRTIALSIRRSAGIVAVSEFTKAEICSLYGLPTDRITVAPNGIDPVFSASTTTTGAPIEPPFFLSIGNLQPRKNLNPPDTCIREALGGLCQQTGEARDRGTAGFRGERVYREAQRLPEGRVVFTSYVDDATLVSLLKGPPPLSIRRCMKDSDCPHWRRWPWEPRVAAADIPVMREVAGPAALLVDPVEPDAWADALQQLSSDSGLRNRLVSAGRLRAQTYTWKRSAERVLGALERAAAGD